jgi:hypothetical protein
MNHMPLSVTMTFTSQIWSEPLAMMRGMKLPSAPPLIRRAHSFAALDSILKGN